MSYGRALNENYYALSPKPGERSQTIYWCQKFAAQRGCVGKNTNILNNYNVTQNLKRTIIYTKLHDMPLSWKLLFGYLHTFFLQKWEMRPANNWNVLYTSSGSPKVLEDEFFCVSSNILSKRLRVFWWFVMTYFVCDVNGMRCDNYRETEELMLWSSISISVKQEMITLSFDWHVPTTQGGWIKNRKSQKKIGYKTLVVMRVLNVEFWRFMKTLWINAVCWYQVTCIVLMLCNYNSFNRNIKM